MSVEDVRVTAHPRAHRQKCIYNDFISSIKVICIASVAAAGASLYPHIIREPLTSTSRVDALQHGTRERMHSTAG